jgi:hypothetical protein
MAAFLFLSFLVSIPAVLIAAGVIGLGMGVYLFFHGFALLQRRRLILDTPFSKIRSASLGLVEVSGLAVGPYTISAPVSERPCFYYHTLVWEWKKQGDDKKWVKVVSECVHVPFFLDDNTGRVLVDPRGAELDIHRDFHEEFCDSFFSTRDPAPDSVRNFLARHGIVTNNKIRVEEFCVKPKNALFILGTLAENPGIEVAPHPMRETENLNPFLGFSLGLNRDSFSSSPRLADLTASPSQQRERAEKSPPAASRLQVIRLSPEGDPQKEQTQQQRITAALLKAGITNPAAWEAAGVGRPAVQVTAAAAEVAPALGGSVRQPGKVESNGFDPHPPVVLMKGQNNHSFLISWRSQREIARALGWKSAAMIWGGPVLALAGLYLLLQDLQLL